MSVGQAHFGSVICAICNAAEHGEDIAPEVQDALTGNVKLPSGFMVPKAAIIPETRDIPTEDPLVNDRSKILIGPTFFVRVIKAAIFGVVDGVKKEVQIPASKRLAKEKKKSRVFAIEDADNNVVDLSHLKDD